MLQRLRTAALPLLGALWITAAQAQTDYPARTVRIVAPFPAGQGTDLIARIVAQEYAQALGQNFIVDNRPGAAGIIGTEIVKNAAPDGYTLLVAGGGPLAINAAMYTRLPYDPIRDFQPIGMIATVPNVLVVTRDFPYANLKDLVAYVKQNPDKLNYGSSGIGVPNHLIMELLKSSTGMQITHVSYKGAAASITALIGGEISMMFETAAAVVPLIKAGKIKAIAVSSPKRALGLPDVPTVAESGVPGFAAQGWSSVVAPATPPKAIVQKLNVTLTAILARPDVRQRLIELAVDPVEYTLPQMSEFMKAEVANWAKAVKIAGVKPE